MPVRGFAISGLVERGARTAPRSMSRPVYLTRRAPSGMVPEQGKRDPAGSIAAYDGVPTAALADRLDFDAARRLGGLPIGHGLGALNATPRRLDLANGRPVRADR